MEGWRVGDEGMEDGGKEDRITGLMRLNDSV